jgi:hypothetical protein
LAIPKFKQIDLACPKCKYPLGSGGNLVIEESCFPEDKSALMISLMKSLWFLLLGFSDIE